MKYRLKDIEQSKEAKKYLNDLIEKEADIEIIHKHQLKSLQQNNYLYLIMSALSLEIGCSLEWLKLNIIKKHLNKDIFGTEFKSKLTNKIYEDYRSIASLDANEIRIVIDRIIKFSSNELQINLPDCSDYAGINRMYNTIEKNKEWI